MVLDKQWVMIISWLDWLTRMGGKGGMRDIWPSWSFPVKKESKTKHLLDWLNDTAVSPEKNDFKITDRIAPAFAPPLLHRSQEHKYPRSTGLFPMAVKTLCSKSNFHDLIANYQDILFSIIIFFCCYLPKEHPAVLSRESGTVGRATLLQQARLVGITSFNIATHLSKCIIHWHTKQAPSNNTHKCRLVQKTKKQLIQTLYIVLWIKKMNS